MTVIRRTRIKFFITMSAIITTIIVAFCASILISTYTRNSASQDMQLKSLLANNNRPSPPMNRPYSFTVILNLDYEIIEYSNSPFFENAEIDEIVLQVKNSNKSKGRISGLLFELAKDDNSITLAVLDISKETSMYSELMSIVFLVGSSVTLILWILLWFLSYWIIKPTAKAFENQKRFISEAGHELKTPITIISVGVELLQKNTQNMDEKILTSIKEQAEKMNLLTGELLTLSKLEELKTQVQKCKFDISQAILTEVLAFESIAYESGKELIFNGESDLMYRGDKRKVREAVAILCDNAIKYSDNKDNIRIELNRQSSKIVFAITNRCSNFNKEELPYLFERFFRGRDVRPSTSGSGLGLAILKTVAEQCDWKVNVSETDGKIKFEIIF